MVVIATFRNAGELVAASARSVQTQNHSNFRAIYVDDGSTDDSHRHVPVDDPRFHLIRHSERQGALKRQIMTALEHCRAGEIVVRLDGDDRLADKTTLSAINGWFSERDCWVSYGQFVFSDSRPGTAAPLTRDSQLRGRALLDLGFPLHPISYRAALLHAIARRERNLALFRSDDGDWFTASTDMVQVVSLMQAAGIGRIYFSDRINYRYNVEHSQLTSSHNRMGQLETVRTFLSRRPIATVSEQEFRREIEGLDVAS